MRLKLFFTALWIASQVVFANPSPSYDCTVAATDIVIHSEPRYAKLSNLVRKAQPYTSSREIPGGSGGAQTYEKIFGQLPGRYLKTMLLAERFLGYESTIRKPTAVPITLPTVISEVPQVSVLETDIILASESHSGSAARVRLGSLQDGRPVAIRAIFTYDVASNSEKPLNDAQFFGVLRDAYYADRLGVGPKVHGVFRDAQGNANLVMDVVPGDFAETRMKRRITSQTFKDLETIFAIFKSEGIDDLMDFQPYLTPQSRLVSIDNDGLLKRPGRVRDYPSDGKDGARTWGRWGLLRYCDLDVGIKYLQGLKRTNYIAWEGIRDTPRLEKNMEMSRYSSYFEASGASAPH